MPNLTAPLKTDLQNAARKLRRLVVQSLAKAASGHPGGSLGMADVFTALFFGGFVRHDPKNPHWAQRDRVVLSNGHICPILYATLAARGYFPEAWLDSLRQVDSHLQGHPALNKTPGVEMSTGSLGHGIATAVGMALALRLDRSDSRVYALMGDGELQEGLCWEAFMAAAHYRLSNLVVIIDRNDAQIDGKTTEIMNIDPLDQKLASFGFQVITVDGHSFESLFDALNAAQSAADRPVALIANTVMGKGVSFMEKEGHKWHGKAPSTEQATLALKEIGA